MYGFYPQGAWTVRMTIIWAAECNRLNPALHAPGSLRAGSSAFISARAGRSSLFPPVSSCATHENVAAKFGSASVKNRPPPTKGVHVELLDSGPLVCVIKSPMKPQPCTGSFVREGECWIILPRWEPAEALLHRAERRARDGQTNSTDRRRGNTRRALPRGSTRARASGHR